MSQKKDPKDTCVLVTGGAGFIGSHTVVELLNCGYEAIIVDDLSNASEKVVDRIKTIVGEKNAERLTFYKADVNNRSELNRIFDSHHVDRVIHFAGFKAVGESVTKPIEYYSNNLGSTLTYSESRVVGPTLGQDSLAQGVVAIGVGIVIVVAYLFFFYHGLGLLTLGSLAAFAILYLGLLALLSHFGAFALTLPGLAGVVLTTGSAADSSILVLERFREEIRMGRSIRQASVSGAKHGIMTSLDADAVTMVTALALFFVAVGSVKGFGLTLALGIVCDVITMFCFKAPALRLLALGPIERAPRFWGVKQDLDEAARLQEETAATCGRGAEKGGESRA